MESLQAPVAIQLVNSHEILDFILTKNLTTTLIFCVSRSDYLADLLGKLQGTPTTQWSTLDRGYDFLSPTLQLLATSRKIKLAFTPTLPHLRAYLAAFNSSTKHGAAWLQCRQSSFPMPILLILGLVDLHRPTNEHSAQGISRTIAIAVESARLAGLKLVIGEYHKGADNSDVNGFHEGMTGVSDRATQGPWAEQIPILSGSVRFGNNEELRTGSTVDVGRVLERWCKFVTLDTMLPGESETLPR